MLNEPTSNNGTFYPKVLLPYECSGRDTFSTRIYCNLSVLRGRDLITPVVANSSVTINTTVSTIDVPSLVGIALKKASFNFARVTRQLELPSCGRNRDTEWTWAHHLRLPSGWTLSTLAVNPAYLLDSTVRKEVFFLTVLVPSFLIGVLLGLALLFLVTVWTYIFENFVAFRLSRWNYPREGKINWA